MGSALWPCCWQFRCWDSRFPRRRRRDRARRGRRRTPRRGAPRPPQPTVRPLARAVRSYARAHLRPRARHRRSATRRRRRVAPLPARSDRGPASIPGKVDLTRKLPRHRLREHLVLHCPAHFTGELPPFGGIPSGARHHLHRVGVRGCGGRIPQRLVPRVPAPGPYHRTGGPHPPCGGRLCVSGPPGSEWTPGTTPAAGAVGYWDTLVIAIDPAARTVVARGRLDPLCLPIADALISCVDELGETVRVARLEVDGR